jgi:hypothetical protein
MMMRDDDVLTPEKVRKLKLHEVIDALACRGLITDTDATKMHCIRHLRNSFIHEEYSLKLPSEIAQKVDASIDDIINYTTILKDKYDESVSR